MQARSKEQEHVKKIALYEQKIELLEIQLRDAEEREANQRKLYDRMFQALDDTTGKDGAHSARSQHKHDPSLGTREIDMLHKQY